MHRNSRLAARNSSAYSTQQVETLPASTASKVRASSSATDVYLTPSGTLVDSDTAKSDYHLHRSRLLAVAIRQRIESRLAGRVHDLSVRVSANKIVLEGRCATYYTKQLAQHAALGVLENEQLENEIVVSVPS